jgi:hypothetical protein
MTNLHNLTVAELREVVALKEKIEALQSEMDSIAGAAGASAPSGKPAGRGRPGKRHMSASARARIGAAQKARWAKIRKSGKASASAAAPVEKKKRRVSRAARARLSAIAKARWARVKAAGESTL